MKKLIAVTVLLAVMAGLTACGRDDDTGSGVTEPPAAVSETAPADDTTTPPEQSPDQPTSPSGS